MPRTYTADNELILKMFDDLDSVLKMAPPKECPVGTASPRGRKLYSIPRPLRALFALIVAARQCLNRYPSVPCPGRPSYFELSIKVERAMKMLETRLRKKAGVSDTTILEYHEEWRYRVLRPQRLKVAKTKTSKKRDEEGVGLSHAYLEESMVLSHWIMVPRT